MALEFNEQLSRLQKPDRAEMTDEEYAVFAKNVEEHLTKEVFLHYLIQN